MKKLIVFLSLIITISLTGCDFNRLDYSDFQDQELTTFSQSKTVSNNKYILYYYDSNDDKSNEIKGDILDFFDTFDAMEFYLLDTSKASVGLSEFGYTNGSTIYVISSNEVLEEYNGLTEITNFIMDYSNIEFEYDLFESQHLTTYEEILSIDKDSYILYYYLDNCPHCIRTKPYLLPWAFTKNVEDIYFMEGSSVLGADNIPTELYVLNSGTPILLLMSNGEFADEHYSGFEEVTSYIEEVGTGEIIAKVNELDYDDFNDYSMTDYSETLTISNNIHFEYFYGSTCGHCNAIKQTVLHFFHDLEGVEFYIMNSFAATGIPKIAEFNGVPALYIVSDNVVVAEYVGSVQVPAFIEAYENGEIDLSIYE